MNKCKDTQNLIDQIIDFDSEDHTVINEHANTCEKCTAYLLAAQQVNQDLQFMTDADDSLVDSTLASILSLQENVEIVVSEDNQNETTTKTKRSYWLKPQWANALAASFMLISLIALFPYNSITNFGLAPEILESSNKQLNDDLSDTKIERQEDGPEQRFDKPLDDGKSVDFVVIESEEILERHRRMPGKSMNLSQSSHPKPSLHDTAEQHKNIRGSYQVTQNMPSPQSPMQDLSKIDLGLKQPDLKAESLGQNKNNFADEQDDREILDKVTVTGSRIRSSNLESPNLVNPRDLSELVSAVKKSANSYEDKDVLDAISVTGSRIKISDLEEPKPITVISRENVELSGMMTAAKDQDGDEIDSIEEVKAEGNSRALTGRERGSFLESSDLSDSNQELNSGEKAKLNKEIHQEIKQKHDLTKNDIAKYQVRKDGGFITLEESPEEIIRAEKPNKKEKAKLQTKGELIGNSITNTEAQNYLTQLQFLENITYKDSSGYWANSYLPGDSQMRLIHSKLFQNKTQGQDVLASISPNIQPFDAPTNSAMAVYLSSDHAKLQSQQPTRMRLQVGLQASQRKGGHRSAMNIGLVYDTQATQADKPTQIKKLKALLAALLKSKQAGDKISLTVSGSEGGLVINSNQFRHGPIQVALNKLLNADESESISLLQALKIAREHTMKTDDSSASLGSSLLILISDKNINNNFNAINNLAHNNAVNGLPMSTVSLDAVNQNQLSQLALTGQGHARILQSTDDAKRIIDEELLVSSRAVARALRLKIRLAKGVKLINVIDSHNLNDSQAQKVRDAEQSLDQRLSKNLGITADRGEDEEGIQIVIPSFYAGDTHVILLDVVVTNSGPIADVTMKYKDLLYLNNAVTRKQLTMDSNPKVLGPLNYNVIKNILAKRFSNDIQAASQSLKNGNKDQALEKLIKLQRLYQSMRVQFPNWNDDEEIFNDQKLLKKYIKLLQSLSLDQSQQVSFVIDSLQYISWRKSTTTPM
jgi:hypothetical protein